MNRAVFVFFFLVMTVIICTGSFAEQIALKQKVRGIIKQEIINRAPKLKNADISVDILYFPDRLYDLEFTNTSDIKINMSKNLQSFTGKIVIPVIINNRKNNVIVNVNAEDKVIVCAKDIQRYDLITSENITCKKYNISSIPNSYIDEFADVKGMEAAYFLRKGTILLDRMIKENTINRKGDKVQIVAKIDNITVKCTGKILQDGYRNSKVWVKNVKSGKKIQGTLIAKDRVIIKTF